MDAGYTPLVRNKNEENVLHLAAKRGRFDVVATLFEREEFDQLVDAPDQDGNLPRDVIKQGCRHEDVLRSVLSTTRYNRTIMALFALTNTTWLAPDLAPLIAKHVRPPRQGEGHLNAPMVSLRRWCRAWL